MPSRLPFERKASRRTRQIHKLLLQPDERNVSQPQLIYPAQLHTASPGLREPAVRGLNPL